MNDEEREWNRSIRRGGKIERFKDREQRKNIGENSRGECSRHMRRPGKWVG